MLDAEKQRANQFSIRRIAADRRHGCAAARADGSSALAARAPGSVVRALVPHRPRRAGRGPGVRPGRPMRGRGRATPRSPHPASAAAGGSPGPAAPVAPPVPLPAPRPQVTQFDDLLEPHQQVTVKLALGIDHRVSSFSRTAAASETTFSLRLAASTCSSSCSRLRARVASSTIPTDDMSSLAAMRRLMVSRCAQPPGMRDG